VKLLRDINLAYFMVISKWTPYQAPVTHPVLRLAIDSKLANVSLVGAAVRSLGRQIIMLTRDLDALELSVVEAVNNIIEHAYHNQPGFLVEVELSYEPNCFICTLRDRGLSRPDLPRPALDFNPAHVALLPEGGMGLYVITHLMDELSYVQEPDGTNTFRMTKYIQPIPDDDVFTH
jgi:serine/threonine-protein kinase RsbW